MQTITKREFEQAFDFSLAIAPLRFVFSSRNHLKLAPFNASVWRGAFGHALRRTACVTGQRSCDGCALLDSCVYGYLFETRPHASADRMRRYNAVPHPFVIRNIPGGAELTDGEPLVLELMLLGRRAQEQLPFVVHALRQAAERGLTRARNKLSLQRVEYAGGDGKYTPLWRIEAPVLEPLPAWVPSVPPLPNTPVQIEFVTPLRLIERGHRVTPATFTPGRLWRSLTRRLAMLEYFHAGHDRVVDFSALHAQADTLEWSETDIRSQSWKRRSSRQQRLIDLTGLTGRVTLDLSKQPELWPWLWLGQWLHTGKATVMGLGQYRVHSDKLVATAKQQRLT
jgi:hypothetical protein